MKMPAGIAAAQFGCPYCQLLLLNDAFTAGRMGNCPRCGGQFICPAGPVARIDGNRNYAIEVVGESHYQATLESICGGRTTESAERGVCACLVLENGNPVDPAAVRVDVSGSPVGYLPQETALRWRSYLKRKKIQALAINCSAMIVGGWFRSPTDFGHFGIRLDLPLRDC